MSIEDLLLPRYKLLADYPLNIIEIGAVFDRCTEFQCVFFDKYPHLFRKLEWWEERKIEDMPAYLKFKSDYNGNDVVYPVKWAWGNKGFWIMIVEDKNIQMESYLKDKFPATLTEYISKQTPPK